MAMLNNQMVTVEVVDGINSLDYTYMILYMWD